MVWNTEGRHSREHIFTHINKTTVKVTNSFDATTDQYSSARHRNLKQLQPLKSLIDPIMT